MGLEGLEPLARLFVFESGTTTQRTIYADASMTVPLSQPVISDSFGTFRETFVAGSDPVRVLITNAAGVPLPGYPADNIVPFATDVTGAGSIPFAPTVNIPATNVQAAIEAAAALALGQSSAFQLGVTPWTTGGSGNAYTITPSPALTTYGEWQTFTIRADRVNTGTTTLNVNGLGARPLRRINRSSAAVELSAGDLQPGRHYHVAFDGVQFTLTDQNAILESNSNGVAIREPSGLLVCARSDITLAFSSTTRLIFAWTFPYVFEGMPWDVRIHLPGATEAYTGMVLGDLAPCATLTLTTTSVTLVANKVTGAANFVSGDTITGVRATAIGRWF